MLKAISVSAALFLSATTASTATAEKVILATPSMCPVVCQQEDGTITDNGIIETLREAYDQIGYELVVRIDTGARSRVRAAIGLADMVLAPPHELEKNSRLATLSTVVGQAPLAIISHPDRPVNLSDISELPKYRLVWNELIEVNEQVKPLFDEIDKAGNLIKIKAGFGFAAEGLRKISNGEADIMLLSQARYSDTLPLVLRTDPDARFNLQPATKMRGHDVKVAFSKKTKLDAEEQRHIINTLANFKPNTSETAQEKTPMQEMMEALERGEDLPEKSKARLAQLPANMLDQVGAMQNLSPKQIAKLKEIHASMQ